MQLVLAYLIVDSWWIGGWIVGGWIVEIIPTVAGLLVFLFSLPFHSPEACKLAK